MPHHSVSMKIEAGPSASASLPSSTATSKVSLSPSSLGAVSTATMSDTLEPSFWNTETVALGGSLANEPVVHRATISGVTMWPTLRAGRLANRMALGDTPSSVSFWPTSLTPRALITIRAAEPLRADGAPIVFWAGAVMALGAAGAVIDWAKAGPAARSRAARRPHV